VENVIVICTLAGLALAAEWWLRRHARRTGRPAPAVSQAKTSALGSQAAFPSTGHPPTVSPS
jgi:hypothetical protein